MSENTDAGKPNVEVVTEEELSEWYNLTVELDTKKAREMELRLKIFACYFEDPKEGTNNYKMDGGFVLKATYPINRKFDEPILANLMQSFRDAKLPVKQLIKEKPELVKAEYMKLTEEQRKEFDKALIIKPGSPQMEIIKPKREVKNPVN